MQRSHASTHKVNDFQAISFADHGLAPLISRHNLQIALHSNPIRRELEPVHQGGQRYVLWHLARLAVEMNADQEFTRSWAASQAVFMPRLNAMLPIHDVRVASKPA